MRNQRGVTITAMVIAIILLIILAAVSITAIRSSNRDIMQTAYDAKTGMEVASYQEELDIIDVYCINGQINAGGDAEYYIDLFEAELAEDSYFDGAEVTRKSSTTLRIETEEGYVFYVTGDGATYIGLVGEITEPEDLTSSDITFTLSDDDWTNENITVTISLNIETDSTLMYSLDGKTWTEYTSSIEIETNETIYACLYNSGVYGTSVSEDITNIDKLEPNSFTITATVDDEDTTTVTISGSTTDQDETSSYGCSEIAYYAFSKDGGETWEYTGSSSTDNEYSFTDLTPGETYEFVMKAVDNAGNETISKVKTVTISSVPDLTDDIVEFTLSEDDWTNEDVTVYVDITDEDIQDDIDDGTYTIEYSTDGGETWEEYDPETGITVDENTEIEVRLTDGTNEGESVTTEVDNIDKTAPDVEVEITDSSTSTITIEVTATDEGDDETSDSSSGIAKYEFQISTDGENWETVETYSSSESPYTYTYDNLEDGETYYVRVVVTDEAGNETISDVEEVTTGSVPGGNDDSGEYDEDGIAIPTVTFSYSETDWTNENVIVTVVVNGDTADLVEDGTYIIEYSVGDPTDESSWTEYSTDGVEFSENGTIYVRLSDGTNAGDYVTGIVSNIDKTNPTAESTLLSSTTNSITWEVTATDEESGVKTIEYYIGESEDSYELKYTSTCSTEQMSSYEYEYTFSDLSDGTTYYLKAVVTDYVGNTSEDLIVTQTTESIISLVIDNTNEEENNITLLYNPEGWTNTQVQVTVGLSTDIQTDIDEGLYDLYYVIDDEDGEWSTYDSDGVIVSENCTIYFKLSDGVNSSNTIEAVVSNIDKVKPTVTTSVSDTTTNSITIEVTAEDEDSGIAKYEFQISENGETWETVVTYESIEETYEYTYKNLTDDTTYYVRVVVTDEAGNSTTSDTEEVTLNSVPGGTDTDSEGNAVISITYSPTYWTNESVTVTAKTSETGYYIQMSSDGTTWETTSSVATISSIEVEENCTVYARLYDGTNSGEYITETITNIDTTAPTLNSSLTYSVTSNSITLGITATDKDSGISNITWYYKNSSDSEYTSETDTYQPVHSSNAGTTGSVGGYHTFSGLTSGTYEAYAVVQDVAGNTIDTRDSDGDVLEITTESMPTASSNISTSYTPIYWTNESVTVSATTSTDYTIEYSTNTTTWTEGSSVEVAENSSVYFRLNDGTNATSDYATMTVTNIDTISPTIDEGLSAEVTSNSITLKISVSDDLSGISNITWYYKDSSDSTYTSETDTYQVVNSSTKGETDSSEYEHTFTDLTSGTYEVYAIIQDVAGNTTDTSDENTVNGGGTTDVTTTEIPSDITFTYSTKTWTSGTVTVTAETTSTGYTIQMSSDGNTYSSTETLTYSSNGEVYARLTDGTNCGTVVSETISWIDKTEPTANISVTDHTYNSITVEATGNDDDSGIYSYEFQISEDGENWETTDIIISSDTSYSYTYEDLIQYTEYYVRVIVTDVAGNATTSESASVTTSVDLDTAIITLIPSTTEWTNETVTVTASTETLGVYIELSTDTENWTETDSLTVSETCTIYARLVDGEGNSSEYASLTVANIDTINPTFTYEITSTAESYVDYDTAGSITVTVNDTDETTSTIGASGIATYYYSNDGGTTYYESTESSYTFDDTSTEDDYEIAVYAIDNATNISETSEETYIPITGDWVDYPIDINGDGDTTNDWRLFYIDDDGIMFIIAADYMENTNSLLNLSGTGMYSWSNSTTYYSKYALTWESVPSTQSVSSSILSLFISTNSTINSMITNGTYNNSKCVTTLLNTSNWTNFVNSTYAQYAIGGPTLEMWIASWNVKYTKLYYGYNSTYKYGYSIGLSNSDLINYQYVTSDDVTNSGYDDTLYFPYHYSDFGDEGWCGGYWLASPNGGNLSSVFNVDYFGYVRSNGYYDDDQNEGTVRPVVALKSTISAEYDETTGIWSLSTN